MGAANRRAWAQQVDQDLLRHAADLSDAVFLSGDRYRQFLADRLALRGVAIHVPMAGLRIGEQLRWLQARSPDPVSDQ